MALCVIAPLTPLIVNVKVPIFVVDVVATDSVDEDANGKSTGFGLKVALELLGRPVTLRLTDPVKPLLDVIEIEYLAAFPRTTVTLAGEAVRAKSGVAVM